jgi:hypothetical protein
MVKLERTGDRPLQFEGELVKQVDTRGHDHSRWHELALYEAQNGKLVLVINYKTQWEKENSNYMALVMTDINEVSHEINKYDPCEFMMDMPTGPQFDQKYGRIRNELIRRFDAALSELLIDYPEVLE